MESMTYKVGLVGSPSTYVEWTAEHVERLKDYGFNTLQLNIAWGCRPHDEPLNLEDVVRLSGEEAVTYAQKLALGSDPSPEAWERRRNDLRHRIELCKQAGVRTIFHFGAPYNGQDAYRDWPLDNCLLDGVTPGRYTVLLRQLHREFPGIDDILIYTYDQDAWLCNEFGNCANCRGIPVHERVAPFINLLAQTWRQLGGGRLWWEPWELSAGQVLQSIDWLDPDTVGLALHSNIAEVTATLPVDRFVKNAAAIANRRGIPFIIEGFLTTATEEVEPYVNLAYPLVTLRQLKAMAGVTGAAGIKEYFGIDPRPTDPNLAMTALFFRNPAIGEAEAIRTLAEPYGDAAAGMARFWHLSSDAMELFPWDVSWFARKIGQSDVSHGMDAAFVRGQQCHTPSWDSTRRAIFMKTDNDQPDPWLLEDVQLRCQLSAERASEALAVGAETLPFVPPGYREQLEQNLTELDGFRRRTLSYAYHLRETNLARVMRSYIEEGVEIPPRLVEEMKAVLKADHTNQVNHANQADRADEQPIVAAQAMLETDQVQFLEQYFRIAEQDLWSKGPHTLTTR